MSKSILKNIKSRHIVYLGLFVTLVAAFFSDGFYHLDENYQIFEFASLYTGGVETADMPWEFKEKMRPTFQPFLVIWLYNLLDFFGLANPFAIATFFRMLVGVCSIYVTVLLYRAFAPEFTTPNQQKIFLLSSLFLWFAVYNHVRFSSETCSALLLFSVVALIQKSKEWNIILGLKVGMLLGFSFLFRYQIAFGIVGLGMYLLFIQKLNFKFILTVASAFIAIVGLGTLLDSYFFGEFVFAPWNYFSQNILEGKAAEFSADPWWEYFRRFFETGFIPIAVLIFFGLILYFRREYKGILFWVFIPFLFFHMIISHKEIRFLFPMIYILPFGIAALYSFIASKGWLSKLWGLLIWRSLVVVNFCLVVYVSIVPANSIIRPYRYVYNNLDGPIELYCYSPSSDYLLSNPLTFYCSKETKVEHIQTFNMDKSEDTLKRYVILKASDVNDASKLYLGELLYSSIPGYLKWVYALNVQSDVHEYQVYVLK